MADLSITAANVQHSSAADRRHGIAAAAITAGQAVYKQTDGQFNLADNDNSATEAAIFGVACNDAAAGQPIDVAVSDTAFAIGATVAVGETYVVSSTAGGIAPEDDLTTGEYYSVVGHGVSTSAISIRPLNTGATHA